jgi:hypothetical protein
MQQLKAELGSTTWANVSAKITELPMMKQAFSAYKELDIGRLASAMIDEEAICADTDTERTVLDKTVPHYVIEQEVLYAADLPTKFHHKERLQFLIEKRLTELTEEHEALISYQKNSHPKKIDPAFYTYVLDKLSYLSRNLSDQHHEVGIAVMQFLHQPTERQLNAFKQAIEKNTESIKHPEIQLLIEYVGEIYPQIHEVEEACQLSLK